MDLLPSLDPQEATLATHNQHQPTYRFIFLLAMVAKRLVKKTKAHVVIRLLGFFLLCFHFLLLSWGSSGGGGRTACWCGSGCWSRPTSSYIADEAPNVDIGQGLQHRQVRAFSLIL